MSKIKTLLIIKLIFHLKNLVLLKGNTCEGIYFTVKFVRLLTLKSNDLTILSELESLGVSAAHIW